jgi:hypothetical protein
MNNFRERITITTQIVIIIFHNPNFRVKLTDIKVWTTPLHLEQQAKNRHSCSKNQSFHLNSGKIMFKMVKENGI